MTRRRLLKLSLLSGLALGGALCLGPHAPWPAPAVPPAVAARLRSLSPRELGILHEVAQRLLAGALDPHAADSYEVALFVDGYLARLDPGIGRDVRGLLHLLEHSPLLSLYRRPFSRLGPVEKDAVLSAWERSGLSLRRQGLQALRSMCLLAHYQDSRSFSAIGYSGPMV